MELKTGVVELRGYNKIDYTHKETGERKSLYQISIENENGMPEVIVVNKEVFDKFKKGQKCVLHFNTMNSKYYFKDIEYKV